MHEGAVGDARLAAYFQAYAFMKAFGTSYKDYLNTPMEVVDTLLIIEAEVREKQNREVEMAERKAAGKPTKRRM